MRVLVGLNEDCDQEGPIAEYIKRWTPRFEAVCMDEDDVAYALMHFAFHVADGLDWYMKAWVEALE